MEQLGRTGWNATNAEYLPHLSRAPGYSFRTKKSCGSTAWNAASNCSTNNSDSCPLDRSERADVSILSSCSRPDSARSARHQGSGKKSATRIDIRRARAENSKCPGVTTQGGRREKPQEGRECPIGLSPFAFRPTRMPYKRFSRAGSILRYPPNRQILVGQ